MSVPISGQLETIYVVDEMPLEMTGEHLPEGAVPDPKN